MKQNLIFLFALFAILFGSVPTFANASTPPSIVISEIAWAGSSLSTSDEWIELANITNNPVDVSGWSLVGASNTPIIFPAGSTIDPHSTFLITNYAHTNTSSTLNTQPQIITTLVSIPNDKLALTLTSQMGSVVDSASNGGNPLAGASGGTGSTADGRYRSMERLNFSLEGTSKEAWSNAETSNGFKNEVLDQGTPGSLNTSLQVALIETQSTTVAMTTDTVVEANTSSQPIPAETTEPIEPDQICEDVAIDNVPVPDEPNMTNGTIEEVVTVVSDPPPASQAPQASPTSPALPPTPPPQGTLRINEIYPRPGTGESEWVELENNSMYPVVTNGWSILDASGAATALPDGVVSPGSYLVIENPKGKLNNDGDSVILKDASGSTVESVLYNADLGSVPDMGESLVRVDASTLTISITPTKNSSNTLTPRPPKPTTTIVSNTSNGTNATNDEPVATNVEVVATTSVVPESNGYPQEAPLQTQQVPIIKTIRLSEFYPNTDGHDATDEFIELENTGDQPVSLDGWVLNDLGGTKFTFTKDASIAAHTFKAFLRPDTKISLNNDGDTITLTAPDGTIVDTQTYDQAKTLLTYARTKDVWNWTQTGTPHEPNTLSGNSASVQPTTPNNASTTQSNGAKSTALLTISEVKQRTDGTRVKIQGVVTALPNTFNSQTMYVQDSTGGIQIFKSDCRFPTLVEGQSITVSGILSHINGEARIKVMNQTSLAVGSLVEAITPSTFTSGDDSSVGSLMTIAGIITSKSGTRLALDVDGEMFNVDLPKTTTAVHRTGERVQVSGILAKNKSGDVLKARSEQDVTSLPKELVEQPAPDITAVGAQEPKETLAIVLILLASLAFLGLKLRPYLYTLTQSYGRKTSLRPRS